MKSEGREMYADLFTGMESDAVQMSLSKDVLDQARKLAEENGWSEEEALPIIFANGLFYLLGRQRLAGLDGHDPDLAAEVRRLTAELMDIQSKYAVIKFRAFTLQQDNQALEFQNTALRVENGMAVSRLDKFREDEEALRADLSRQRTENEQLRQRLGLSQPVAVARTPPSLFRRLLPWLRQ